MKLPSLFPFGTRKGLDGTIPPNFEKMGIFLPTERRIGSCMTHRPDIVWIDSASDSDSIRVIMEANPNFTQFPVCSGSVDKVLGVVTVRQFLESLLKPTWPGLRDIVRKAVFLPETVTILRALRALDESEGRLAFIIDEYGGVEGMVTRNGLVRELLEEVRDTSPAGEPEPDDRPDGSRLLDGQTRMEEIRDTFDLPEGEDEAGDYYTLAGFLLTLNGSIPKPGDAIETGGYRWEVASMDGNRIETVLVTPIKGGGRVTEG